MLAHTATIRCRLCVVTLRFALVALSAILFPVGSAVMAAEGGPVVVVLSGEGGAYREFTESMTATVRRQLSVKPDVTAVAVENFNPVAIANTHPVLIVSVGTHATERVLQSKPAVPVLASLVPRIAFETIRRTTSRCARR